MVLYCVDTTATKTVNAPVASELHMAYGFVIASLIVVITVLLGFLWKGYRRTGKYSLWEIIFDFTRS